MKNRKGEDEKRKGDQNDKRRKRKKRNLSIKISNAKIKKEIQNHLNPKCKK
jgi:hypothetical protein